MDPVNGRPALPVLVALGACIIKGKLGATDKETVERVRKNHTSSTSWDFDEYRDEPPFDPSMMVHFRKRLSGTILKEINDFIVEREVKATRTYAEGKDKDPPEGKGGDRWTLIADAMRFPHDVTTLDESRR